jgi:hypothetical protein
LLWCMPSNSGRLFASEIYPGHFVNKIAIRALITTLDDEICLLSKASCGWRGL